MSGGRLPSGTLTFLFTDIEGSTKLGVALGTERYHEVLEMHTRTLRAAFSDGGIEVRIDGDSLVMVFASAAKAVRAAAAAQRGLAVARFPHGATVRVRMGLHTGEGTLGSAEAGADYVGTDIVRAARITSVAHGGQVLLSDSTRAVIGDELPDGVRVRALGTFRLKDLTVPERIHQLEIQGLPPLTRTLDLARLSPWIAGPTGVEPASVCLGDIRRGGGRPPGANGGARRLVAGHGFARWSGSC